MLIKANVTNAIGIISYLIVFFFHPLIIAENAQLVKIVDFLLLKPVCNVLKAINYRQMECLVFILIIALLSQNSML